MKKALVSLLVIGCLLGGLVHAEDTDDTPPAVSADVMPDGGIPKKGTYQDTVQGSFTYLHIRPAFITNLSDTTRYYLSVEVSLVIKNEEIVEVIKANMPLIKHTLNELFTQQTVASLNTADGKIKLQREALDAVNQALEAYVGPGYRVKMVLFTKFAIG